MLIVCPSCASEYTIDTARVGARGREVRCASCRESWFVRPPKAGRALVATGTRRASSRSSASEAGRSRRTVSAGTLGALALAAFGLALPALAALREPVVRLAPGTAGLYAAIGLPVNLVGLRLEDVSSTTGEETGARVLVVEGALASDRAVAVAVPRLAYAIEDADGAVLYGWTAKPPVETLAPGETIRFTARLAAPPPAGKRILVGFAPVVDGPGVVASR